MTKFLFSSLLLLTSILYSQTKDQTVLEGKLRLAYTNGIIDPNSIVTENGTYYVSHFTESDHIVNYTISKKRSSDKPFNISVTYSSIETELYQSRLDAVTFSEDDPCGNAFYQNYLESGEIPRFISCFGRSYRIISWEKSDDRIFMTVAPNKGEYCYVSFPINEDEIKRRQHEQIMTDLENSTYYQRLVSEHGYDIKDIEYIYSDFSNGPSIGMDKKLVDVYVQDEELLYNYYLESQKVAQYVQTYNVNEYIIFTFAWDDSGKITDVRREEL